MVNSSPDTAAAKIDWARIKSAFFFFPLPQSLKPNRPFNTSLLVQTRVGWGDSFFYKRRMQLTKKSGLCVCAQQANEARRKAPIVLRCKFGANSGYVEKRILHGVVSLSLWMGNESLFQFPTVRTAAVASPWATDISSFARNESIKQTEIDMNEIMFILFQVVNKIRWGGAGGHDNWAMHQGQKIPDSKFATVNKEGFDK